MKDRTPLELDARVAGTAQRNSGISWPLAVDVRLDQLLAIATEQGERTSRKELLAAILVAFDEAADLGDLVRRYRRTLVREVIIADDADDDGGLAGVVEFLPNSPGPRRVRPRGA